MAAPAGSPLRGLLPDFIRHSLLSLIKLLQPRWRFRLDALGYAPGTSVLQSTMDLISLAQHYEYGSTMRPAGRRARGRADLRSGTR